MGIVPDTKDWTWVVEARCDECGTDVPALDREQYGRLTREVGARWARFLEGAGPDLRTRPDDSTWAPIEYACHVRDVVRRYDERLQLMLEQDDPHFPNWDQDATAVEDRYLEQDPSAVAAAIVAGSAVLADRFESVTDWERTGNRSDGARFTIDGLGRYFLHDPLHHLHDVGAAG